MIISVPALFRVGHPTGIGTEILSMDVIEHAVTREIEALHRFLVAWFSGAAEDNQTLFKREFVQRFDVDFLLVPPNGIVLDLESLLRSIRSAYGSNPDFRIAIRNVKVRRTWDRVALATYEEWQRNAMASTPADNGRVASVLIRFNEPMRWLQVHETWLPADVIAAGRYDF